MSGHSTFDPKSGLVGGSKPPADHRLHALVLRRLSQPANLNYWWTFGAILSFMLMAQIVTGIVLTMHYTPESTMAFSSVENIMRDVN